MSILKIRNKSPKINFDFGEIEKTITIGQSANIWLNTIYNSEYTLSFSSIPNVKVNKNLIVVTPIEVGEFKISIKVQSKGRVLEIKSNEIKLTVE